MDRMRPSIAISLVFADTKVLATFITGLYIVDIVDLLWLAGVVWMG